MALPVPHEAQGGDGRWKVLPGAPLAFVGEGTDGYADVAQLRDWFDKDADFSPSVRDEVITYFSGEGSMSRSFVSRRLSFGGANLGVLNLHSNRPNLLGLLGDETGGAESVSRREEFFALMTPLLRELECAVALSGAEAETAASDALDALPDAPEEPEPTI
jgi:hypothetical protein